MIRLIKAWAHSEGSRDEENLNLCDNPTLVWPWATEEELAKRLVPFAQATDSSGVSARPVG